MANVQVFITNNSGQKCGLTLDEDSDFLAHLRVMEQRGEFDGLDVKGQSAKTEPVAKKARVSK